jgi:hypothetical protein
VIEDRAVDVQRDQLRQELLPCWDAVAPGAVRLLGLAAAVRGERAAAVLVTDRALPDGALGTLDAALAGTLGAPVETAALDGPADDLPRLLRQWVNQAAQGTGRGIRVEVSAATAGGGASRAAGGGERGLRIGVRSVDSSARELAMRLASPWEPALPALVALLGGVPVLVEDAEAGG